MRAARNWVMVEKVLMWERIGEDEENEDSEDEEEDDDEGGDDSKADDGYVELLLQVEEEPVARELDPCSMCVAHYRQKSALRQDNRLGWHSQQK